MNKKTNICSESPGCVPCLLLYGRATVIGRTSCVGVDKWRFFRLNMGIRLEECGETTLTHVVTQYELRASLFVASKEKSPTFCWLRKGKSDICLCAAFQALRYSSYLYLAATPSNPASPSTFARWYGCARTPFFAFNDGPDCFLKELSHHLVADVFMHIIRSTGLPCLTTSEYSLSRRIESNGHGDREGSMRWHCKDSGDDPAQRQVWNIVNSLKTGSRHYTAGRNSQSIASPYKDVLFSL